jgi:hypothetical protein
LSTLDQHDAWLAAERASPNREEDANGYLRPVSPDKYLPGGPSNANSRNLRLSGRWTNGLRMRNARSHYHDLQEM